MPSASPRPASTASSPGKGSILATVYRRAADRVSGDLSSDPGFGAKIPAMQSVNWWRPMFGDPSRIPNSPMSTMQSASTFRSRIKLRCTTSSALSSLPGPARWPPSRPNMSINEAHFAVHAGFALVGSISGQVHALPDVRLLRWASCVISFLDSIGGHLIITGDWLLNLFPESSIYMLLFRAWVEEPGRRRNAKVPEPF